MEKSECLQYITLSLNEYGDVLSFLPYYEPSWIKSSYFAVKGWWCNDLGRQCSLQWSVLPLCNMKLCLHIKNFAVFQCRDCFETWVSQNIVCQLHSSTPTLLSLDSKKRTCLPLDGSSHDCTSANLDASVISINGRWTLLPIVSPQKQLFSM